MSFGLLIVLAYLLRGEKLFFIIIIFASEEL